ncbi:hypothetical protein [Candidatus Methanoperedens nitratireducens]|uniref:Uncharacterized protein n=1 Tax=Candidatus Methanoperedens nitratireducens TaxID=1392998 RepID=A0A284VN59_9EURY|nr:hypothetical protein [Candidatus Methanoperedens nitroreducens]SNQ60682.1 hypothetical protein MNV_20058 [Candidatus Methanoperedens nitroreducens]
MEITNIIILWLHYLATVVWIGGMAFNIMVLRPSMTVIEQNERLKISDMVRIVMEKIVSNGKRSP